MQGNGPLLKFAEMKITQEREKGNHFAGKTERGMENGVVPWTLKRTRSQTESAAELERGLISAGLLLVPFYGTAGHFRNITTGTRERGIRPCFCLSL